jgi:phage anti-repressor protein
MLNSGCDALDSEGQAAGFPDRREETKFINPKDFLLIEQSPSWEANIHSRDQNISLNLRSDTS